MNYSTQRQVEDVADQNLAAGGHQLSGHRAALAKIRAQNEAVAAFNSMLPAEVRALGEGLSMRSAPPFQAPQYEAFSHTELRDMVTRGVHAGTVGEAGDTWLAMGDDLACFHDEFTRALDTSATAWTGAGANAARQAVAELANAGARTGQAAQLAGMATHQVSRALSLANHHMPAPAPNRALPSHEHPGQHWLQSSTDPIKLGTQAASDLSATAHASDAHQRAAHIVREYDKTVAESAAHMPAFETPPHITPWYKGRPPPPPGPHPRPGPPHPTPGWHEQPTPDRTSGATGYHEAGPTPTSAAAAPGSAHPFTSGSLPYGTGLASTDPSGWGGNLADGPGSADLAGGAAAGLVGSPGARSLATPAGDLPRASVGFEPAAGRPGTAGPFGAMPPGGRGGEKDREHKAPDYLIEPDPDSIFGIDQRTVPPVIE